MSDGRLYDDRPSLKSGAGSGRITDVASHAVTLVDALGVCRVGSCPIRTAALAKGDATCRCGERTGTMACVAGQKTRSQIWVVSSTDGTTMRRASHPRAPSFVITSARSGRRCEQLGDCCDVDDQHLRCSGCARRLCSRTSLPNSAAALTPVWSQGGGSVPSRSVTTIRSRHGAAGSGRAGRPPLTWSTWPKRAIHPSASFRPRTRNRGVAFHR